MPEEQFIQMYVRDFATMASRVEESLTEVLMVRRVPARINLDRTDESGTLGPT